LSSRAASCLLVALLLVLPSAVFLPAPVEAHAGRACGLTGLRLEGECFTIGDGACDPDGDREHTQVVTGAHWSNGAAAFLPGDGCNLHYGSIPIGANSGFVWAGLGMGGAAGSFTFRLLVYTGNALIASGDVTMSPCECVHEVRLTVARVVDGGSAPLRIAYDVLSGSSYLNLYVDYLDLGNGTRASQNASGRVAAPVAGGDAGAVAGSLTTLSPLQNVDHARIRLAGVAVGRETVTLRVASDNPYVLDVWFTDATGVRRTTCRSTDYPLQCAPPVGATHLVVSALAGRNLDYRMDYDYLRFG